MELIRRTSISLFSAIIFLTYMFGEIQISESATQFRYPKFSDNGYIEWVLQGNSGNYSESKISIEGLNLRIYSGDKLSRPLSSITGKNCILDSDTEIASSDDSIIIKGSGFNLSGNQWTYNLSKEIISLKSDAFVRFSQNIDSIFSGVEQGGETTITSNKMRLIIEPNRYLFTFEGDCTLSSDSFILKAQSLEIELLNSSNKLEFTLPTGELSGMKSIEGKGEVNFIGMGQLIESDNFIIKPPESSALFEGNALIQYNQIALEGDSINWKQNQVEIISLNNNLSSFSNFQLDTLNLGKGHTGTYIQAKEITVFKQDEAYEYIFNKNVFSVSEFYQISADSLSLKTEVIRDDNSSEFLQDITLTEAYGNVMVKHQDYLISGQKLKFSPLNNQLDIEDNVTYVSSFAKLKSERIFLANNTLLASSSDQPIEVELPNTPDLNFELDSNPSRLESKQNTIVYATDLNITINDFIYDCEFSGAVKLVKNDFSILSDFLTMSWIPNDTTFEKNTEYKMNAMTADGSVKMDQMNYSASANFVEILPDEKMFHLVGDAHFKDVNGSIWGDRIEFDRNLKQTKVIGQENGERARIRFDLFEAKEENLEDSRK